MTDWLEPTCMFETAAKNESPSVAMVFCAEHNVQKTNCIQRIANPESSWLSAVYLSVLVCVIVFGVTRNMPC